MHLTRPRVLPSLLMLALFAAANLPAQAPDVRELTTPTAHINLLNVTPAIIGNYTSTGYRLVDIEYRSGSGSVTTFDAVFVQNSGAYATGWWWYYGLSSAQVSSYLASNQARLIDLEPYQDSTGTQRFACIMVNNTGVNAKTWWWYFNTSTTYLSTQLSNNNARLVDLDVYTLNGSTYYSGVMIRNTGNDARSWWWYLNVTPAQMNIYLSTNQARLYDIERRSNGNWDCVMIRDTTPKYWYWWYDMSSSDIVYLLNNYGVRVIDFESYLVGTTRRYAMLTLNNVNALTTDVGNGMRATTNGQVGCWLEQINGSNLASLNGTTQFEPASTMKTLLHVHAMRRVALGATSLGTNINVYTNYSPTNASCPINSGAVSEPLQTVLQLMMENSDNARTQAIRAYFGQSNINATATAIGMTGTSLNHTLGCGAEAIANPNRMTLRDLHTLHEAVANGYLGSYRDTFYDLMLQSLSGLAIDTLINSEGASLGLPSATITSFRNFTKMAHKGGNYSLNTGGPQFYHRAEFGWISLPFIVSDVITPREYSFGAFVNDASNDSNASSAIYTHAIPDLLRSTVHAALQSWNNSLAGVMSVGAGCGSPVYSQTVTGLPRIGTTVTYRGNSGFANAITVLGIGFSNVSWGGVPLPAPLAPIGAATGCFAFNDVQITYAAVANSAGLASFPIALPSSLTGVGFEYLTQFYSFGPSSFVTSNGFRSIVGL
ncbi:MAG TPA: serine hydrolase [Planctomycetota bacterium]|nr:serine hydrolase [Planctomycetota bacterium]